MSLVKVKRSGPRGWHLIDREKYDANPGVYELFDAPSAPASQSSAGMFDHDGDGRAGSSPPASERIDAALIAEAESFGVRVDGRWSERRLREEIDKVKRA